MKKCLTEYIHHAGGVDIAFVDGRCNIFDYNKVPHIGLVIDAHISTVDGVGLVLSEKVFWSVHVW
jgi:prepilin-type processing-associated H-X9-DG protein